mmetsp:Transcript_704/g.1248  ORF Transcript_704/g.1248 Transcript_704/m.1248 type:complete len:240 (+) Transcript_704:256-975(+)|eukprot:CAMPEP_0197533230 /NCGR_PEP_ID=MMETSP1318-20131121/42698_1 /TAXON_ID=552666 /ORGANISM="Partenskyella glossopodia, Strain RCC365" /LENGTH=239 /DNA_ID=CAMNT_0043090059 /DNA_START=176 /DNA_END=895 /DNA_ORIENTATION=-
MGAMFAVAADNVPSGLVDFFHGIQVAITLALMTNVVQFAWWTRKGLRSKEKRLTHCARYAPVYVLLLSTCLVMVQPTCMLVISSWKINNFFFDGGNTNALVPNTVTGWMIQGFCTYFGYLLLFTGVLWSTQLHKKIARKWRLLRGGNGSRNVGGGGNRNIGVGIDKTSSGEIGGKMKQPVGEGVGRGMLLAGGDLPSSQVKAEQDLWEKVEDNDNDLWKTLSEDIGPDAKEKEGGKSWV